MMSNIGMEGVSTTANSSQGPAFERDEVSIISPLRYPGSKRRLAGYIQRALELNGLRPALFVEPFAGGASVALQLLNNNAVEHIILSDIDPLVAAFWQTVFFDTDWLIEQVNTIEVTIDMWHHFKNTEPTTTRDQALKCLFLNRTSFSGILKPEVGPIGGRAQASAYPIDCRFPRATLTKRIQQAAKLKARVKDVWHKSWSATLADVHALQRQSALPTDAFFYFDPPFFEKADKLYTHYFTHAQHIELRDAVLSLQDPWILSYDAAKQVHELYEGAQRRPIHVELLYSTAASPGSRPVQEVILTNLDDLPQETRLWRNNAEWKNGNGATSNTNGRVMKQTAEQLHMELHEPTPISPTILTVPQP